MTFEEAAESYRKARCEAYLAARKLITARQELADAERGLEDAKVELSRAALADISAEGDE